LKNIEKTIAELLSTEQYENMVIHYNLLRIFLDRDYDVMVNQTLYTSFIKPVLETGKYNQMVIVLLARALANAVNKEIWRHFLNCKHEYHVFVDKSMEKKESKATEALKQAGKPASVQIKEQVDAHLKKALKRAENEEYKIKPEFRQERRGDESGLNIMSKFDDKKIQNFC
jgi:hypothetical protein